MEQKNKLSLSVQYPDTRLKEIFPRTLVRRRVQSALQSSATITVRFVDAEEGRALNRDYRKKDYPTNVLTFEYGEDNIQADIILCTDVLIKEAKEQKKTLEAHITHLLIHGILHAQGYDHEDKEEAEEMEELEIKLLKKMGFPNPYR